DVDERIDVSGMVVLAGAVLALLVALDQGADWGWASAPVLGLLVVSICLLAVFPLVERQVRDPLLPMDLLSNRPFLITLAGNGLCVPAFFIAFLYFPQYMTKSLNWTTWNAALGMVPLMVLLSVGSVVSGRFYKVLGPKRLLCIGFLLLFAGCLAVLFLEPAWGYLGLLLPVMLIGLGATLCVGPAGTASIAAVQEKRAGLAGGLSFTTHLICGAVGVAAATAILYDTSRRALEAGLSAAGITLSAADQKVLIGNDPDNKAAQEIFAKLSAEQVDAARTLLIDAFASGLSNAYWVAVVAAFFGLVAMLMLDEDKLRTAEAS
ncbi:MAG: MFS transporter, partial [Pseudomonadota bacterium]